MTNFPRGIAFVATATAAGVMLALPVVAAGPDYSPPPGALNLHVTPQKRMAPEDLCSLGGMPPGQAKCSRVPTLACT